MSIQRGHEDLQPKEVLNLPELIVKNGDTVTRYKAFIMPGGALKCIPVEEQEKAPIDQLVPREKTPVAHRWAGVDQQQ